MRQTIAGSRLDVTHGMAILGNVKALLHRHADGNLAYLALGYLAPEEVTPFQEANGLLNEFKMLWHFRYRFPLHSIVFKQVSSHLPHEANVEQYFSRAGAISDPNQASQGAPPAMRGSVGAFFLIAFLVSPMISFLSGHGALKIMIF
jgi:hypothetical protein